jgi:hypothetical protein
MSLIEVNWRPNNKQLRGFGKIALIALAVISLVLYLAKGLATQWALAIVAVGSAIFIASLISFKLTRVIYLALVIATLPIGLVVSFLLLAAFYFLLLTPLGLIFHLIGRDPLRRKFDSTAESYWLTHDPPRSPERYFRQF